MKTIGKICLFASVSSALELEASRSRTTVNRLSNSMKEGDSIFVSCNYVKVKGDRENWRSKAVLMGSQKATADDTAGSANFYL